jgi:hypothetical protein
MHCFCVQVCKYQLLHFNDITLVLCALVSCNRFGNIASALCGDRTLVAAVLVVSRGFAKFRR